VVNRQLCSYLHERVSSLYSIKGIGLKNLSIKEISNKESSTKGIGLYNLPIIYIKGISKVALIL
jgi:hypothetical protein